MENKNLIYVYLFIALVLSNIPFLHSFIKGNARVSKVFHAFGMSVAIANTLVHESCHALMSLVTGGRIRGVSLSADTSGLAETTSNSRVAKILVSYAGYTGSSLVAVGLFYLLYLEKYEWILYFFIVLSAINWLFWVRNLFGFLWLTAFIGMMVFFLYKHFEVLLIHISIFLACMVLMQSIISAFVILKLSVTDRRNAGDASNLARFTFIPTLVWGTLFFVQSIGAAFYIVRHFIFV
ncbi:M50 family metallopeptidase [Psychrobacillus sp. FSL K6-4615]|uniref:M50 family metallopeptidase n=1 Tax=Psychrobacillus sp. FSL K6-4615 TaxID=2921551 RepID=UPI0030F72454